MYEIILNEARGVDDIRNLINGATLLRLWPRLTLPPDLRDLWESHIPALAGRSAA